MIGCISNTSRFARIFPILLSFILVSVVLVGLPGCYTEVINAKGLTADSRYPRRGKSSKPKIDQAIDDFFNIEDN